MLATVPMFCGKCWKVTRTGFEYGFFFLQNFQTVPVAALETDLQFHIWGVTSHQGPVQNMRDCKYFHCTRLEAAANMSSLVDSDPPWGDWAVEWEPSDRRDKIQRKTVRTLTSASLGDPWLFRKSKEWKSTLNTTRAGWGWQCNMPTWLAQPNKAQENRVWCFIIECSFSWKHKYTLQQGRMSCTNESFCGFASSSCEGGMKKAPLAEQ